MPRRITLPAQACRKRRRIWRRTVACRTWSGLPATSGDLAGHETESPWRRDPVLACNDGLGLKMAALAGAGLLLQPEILLTDELRDGRLIRVLDNWLPAPRPVHMLYRQDLRPLPKLSHFIAHLQEACQEPAR